VLLIALSSFDVFFAKPHCKQIRYEIGGYAENQIMLSSGHVEIVTVSQPKSSIPETHLKINPTSVDTFQLDIASDFLSLKYLRRR
jgi:hypothetical protein